MNKLNFGSWKTSTGGIIAVCIFLFVIVKVWNSYLTGQPIDTDTIVSGAIALSNTVIGFTARDNDKSSQDVGVR